MNRPAVFFLSDGQPTEKEAKWKERLAELKDPAFNERPNILAFGVGDADPKVIPQLATSPAHAFMMREGVSSAGAIAETARVGTIPSRMFRLQVAAVGDSPAFILAEGNLT